MKLALRNAVLTQYRGLYDEIRTIMVVSSKGEAKQFVIYKNLASYYSTYLASAFSADDSETELKLVEVEPRIFELFLQWLNAGRFDYKSKNWLHDGEDIYGPLVELYELAERLGTNALMNLTITTIREVFIDNKGERFFSIPLINRVYPRTHKGSPLRRIIRDMFAFNADETMLQFRKTVNINPEFEADVRARLFQRTRTPGLLEPKASVYHLNERPDDEDDCQIIDEPQVVLLSKIWNRMRNCGLILSSLW